jgi:D-cysteine desulfhydrase
MTSERALFNRYPALLDALPFVELADLPTPLSSLKPLADELNIEELVVKCDDISAQDYGGNKLRKLEFLLADAQTRGCSNVITFGGMGSNHALATSINCQRLGLACTAILTPEPVTEAVKSTLLYHQQLGTRLELARYGAELRGTADRLIAELGPDQSYEIPFGGSSWVGAIGFVNAGLELDAQIQAGLLAKPDSIYIACGTTGSIAGLALGLQLAGLDIAIEAIQVTPNSLDQQQLFDTLYTDANAQLHQRDPALPLCDIRAARVNIRDDQLGEGYAMPTPEGRAAAELLRQQAGIKSSLTYTAKAMAGLVSDARKGLLADRAAMLWNTYNSRPYPEFAKQLDVTSLPKDFQPYFS